MSFIQQMLSSVELPTPLLEKMDFDYFMEYQLRIENLSRSENTALESDTNSTREKAEQNIALSKVSNAMIQYSISRTIGALVIINEGFDATKEVRALFDSSKKKTIRERILSGLHNSLFYEPTLMIMKEGLADMINYKIANDIYNMKTTLESTIAELQSHETFSSLQTKQGVILFEEQQVHDIIFDYIRTLAHVNYLKGKETVAIENLHNLKEDWNEQFAILQETVDDCIITNCIETRYINKWVATRLEQKEIAVNTERDALLDHLNEIIKTTQNESDLSNDIDEFLEQKIHEIDEAVEYWMKKCDTEIDQMDEEIQLLTDNNKVLEVRASDAKEEFYSHQKEMDEFWEAKRLAAEKILLEQKKLKFAIRIQAWWRGTMVRRHLGPFRRHKRKGKGRKGKKGKKK